MSSIGAAVAAFAALEALTRPFGRRRSRRGGDGPPDGAPSAVRDGANAAEVQTQPTGRPALRLAASARIAPAE
ncbi:MAG: hypothetical protein MUE98_06230 [Rhodobacteraceae bacterium]|jgi:hypothetical protein|nr:hypothetical protein [Paracoccaceae bacterium]